MEEKNITSPRQATVEQPDVANAETNTSPLNNTQLSTPKDDVLSPNVALDVTDGTMDITSNVINELTVITPDIADETADTKLGLESELVDVTRIVARSNNCYRCCREQVRGVQLTESIMRTLICLKPHEKALALVKKAR